MDAQHGFEAPQSPHEDRGCCFIEAELLVWERSFLPNIMIEVFLVDDQDEVASKRNKVQVFFLSTEVRQALGSVILVTGETRSRLITVVTPALTSKVTRS